MKVWATKHALTAGILEYAVKEVKDGMAIVRDRRGLNGASYFHGEGRQWHRTRESAVTRAEEMRLKKIAALRKQIAALEKLTFKVE